MRLKADHLKHSYQKMKSTKKSIDQANVKLAFYIHKQSSSIDVRKQLGDFESHQKLL